MELSNPNLIQIKDYNYVLPEEKIAKYPLSERDQSKLLIYKNKRIKDQNFKFISEYLPENSLIIFNNTKVIQARMFFQKITGAQIEIFCLDPHSPSDYNLNFQSITTCTWNCMIGNLKKWKDETLEKEINIGKDRIILKARKACIANGNNIVEFAWDNPKYTFADILENSGELPIPPYLNRDTEEKDKETYQTLYSKIKGSVAAPTAGLHFTPKVLEDIRERDIPMEEVTLHVGAGTFKPVKSETLGEHEMHSEFISVKKEVIEKLLSHEGSVIAVGTTSVRTLESLYYIGSSLKDNSNNKDLLKVEQWQPYKKENNLLSKKEALANILVYLDKHHSDVLLANTQIMIVPGYKFKIVDAIVTNFHQPQSTLLLLISAFVDGDWKSIYNHALTHDYRFLSYGDSSLLFR